MGLLTDILKEIPQAAVLKEKIAQIEARYAASDTENAILKDDNRELKAEMILSETALRHHLLAKLKNEIEELSHKDSKLHELEVQLLQLIGDPEQSARYLEPSRLSTRTHYPYSILPRPHGAEWLRPQPSSTYRRNDHLLLPYSKRARILNR